MFLARAVPGITVTSAGEIPGIPGGNSSSGYAIFWYTYNINKQTQYLICIFSQQVLWNVHSN